MTALRRTALIAIVTVLSFAAGAAEAGAPVAEGEWTKKSATIEGGWSIVESDGEYSLLLDDQFKTKSAPDLKLFLTARPLADVSGKDATSAAILIAKLDDVRGSQRYRLPEGIDLTRYSTLLLHCEKYAKLWGGAQIRSSKTR